MASLSGVCSIGHDKGISAVWKRVFYLAAWVLNQHAVTRLTHALRVYCWALYQQVQKLKLDTEAAMLELDQILRANELTVAVVAAIPSLAIAGGTGYLLIRWVTPSPPDRKSEALPARCPQP